MIDAVLVRASVRPCSWTAAPWPDVALDGDGEHRARWRDWLRRVWDDDVAEAINVASPVLAERVRAVCDGHTTRDRDLRRAVESTARYLIRASSRATPFGLFAGVTPAQFQERTTATTAPRSGGHDRTTARVDAAWLARVLDTVEAIPQLRRRLRVMANPALFIRDGRLVLACQPHPGGDATAAEVSVKLTKAVELATHAARAPVTVDAVLAALTAEFPATSLARVETMLAELVTRCVLITSLRPTATTVDPLAHVTAQLAAAGAEAIPDAAGIAARLHTIEADLRRHNDTTSPARQRALRATASATMATLAPAERALSVDRRLDDTVALPTAVAREAQAAAGVLTRLAPHPTGTPPWRDYHCRFLEKYGPGAHVRVTDLVHVDTGLGFPAGYRDTRLPFPLSAGSALTERDAALLALAQHAALDGSREITLDEDMLARLVVDEIGTVQPHTELRIRIHAPTRNALDDGDFELVIAGVSRAAGTTTGRFLDLLDEADRTRMTSAYRALPTLTEGAIPVQVSCPPLYPRAENVARSPQILSHLLSFGEHHEADAEAVELDDLAVTADADRLYLVSLSRHTPVEPTVFSAVEFSHAAPPLLWFLCEISTARATICAPFSWGAAGRLPFLPRVRSGRTILSPARWTLTSSDLPEPAAPTATWTARLLAWRDRYQLPESVYVGDDDRRLHLRFDQPAHRALLRAGLDRAGTLSLREAPGIEEFGWCDGRAHEVVVPLAADQPVPTRLSQRYRSTRTVAPEDAHLPGSGEWLYLKLYGHPDRHNTIIVNHLPRLLSTVDSRIQWWFLRYADPDPHLRLRLAPAEHTSAAKLLSRVHSWTTSLRERGLIGHAQLDTYYPEVGRFGHGPAMRAAEAVFAADSDAVLAQLTHTTSRSPTAHPHALLAASIVDLACAVTAHSGADTDTGMRWLIEHIDRTSTQAPARALRDEAIRLANPDYQWAALRALPGGGDIVTAWAQRRTALGDYRDILADPGQPITGAEVLPDLIHLHVVRMTGVAPHTERACARLARGAALSWTARRKGAR